MSRLRVLTAIALFSAISSACADGQVWTVQSWPGDIDLIPCSAWSKTGDGRWVLHGSVKLGAATMGNIGVKGDAAAHKLDRECGAEDEVTGRAFRPAIQTRAARAGPREPGGV